MECPKCKMNMRVQNELKGYNKNGEPEFQKVFYCDRCMLKVFDDTPEIKKESTLSTVACVLSIFVFTSFVGAILGIIDICINDKSKRHVGSWFAIIVFVIVLISGIGGFTLKSENGNKTEKESSYEETYQETQEKEILEVETQIENEVAEEVIEETEEEYKASCEEYKYKDVLRNPEDYVGKRIKITVKISTVHEASWLNDTKYYFAYSKSDYGWYGDKYGIFDKRENQGLKLLEDDIITVYGEIADPEYTTSLIVSGSELFCIDMKYIDFISE